MALFRNGVIYELIEKYILSCRCQTKHLLQLYYSPLAYLRYVLNTQDFHNNDRKSAANYYMQSTTNMFKDEKIEQ